jgi:hypothetical protein
MHQQHETQKKLLSYKRIMIILFCFVVILALANMGTAFAAAILAKDTTTNNGVLVDKYTGEPVQTDNHVNMYQVTQDSERRLGVNDTEINAMCSPSCNIAEADALAILENCQAGKPVMVRLYYSLTGGEFLTSYPVCDNNRVETITTAQNRDDGTFFFAVMPCFLAVGVLTLTHTHTLPISGSLEAYNVTSTSGHYSFIGPGDNWLFAVPVDGRTY